MSIHSIKLKFVNLFHNMKKEEILDVIDDYSKDYDNMLKECEIEDEDEQDLKNLKTLLKEILIAKISEREKDYEEKIAIEKSKQYQDDLLQISKIKQSNFNMDLEKITKERGTSKYKNTIIEKNANPSYLHSLILEDIRIRHNQKIKNEQAQLQDEVVLEEIEEKIEEEINMEKEHEIFQINFSNIKQVIDVIIKNGAGILDVTNLNGIKFRDLIININVINLNQLHLLEKSLNIIMENNMSSNFIIDLFKDVELLNVRPINSKVILKDNNVKLVDFLNQDQLAEKSFVDKIKNPGSEDISESKIVEFISKRK